jgi:hypothetical protein
LYIKEEKERKEKEIKEIKEKENFIYKLWFKGEYALEAGIE